MTDLTLFHLPGACSRVTLTALEHVGVAYKDHVVNLMKGEQHSPGYLAVNPRGKIPALLVDGELLAENAAILSYLHRRWPEAGVLPRATDPLEEAQILADLFWLASFWHPTVRAMRMPVRWTTGDPAPIKERGRQLLAGPIAAMDQRFAGQEWWFGDDWSICDTYFYWVCTAALEGGFDFGEMPGILAHRARVEAQPAFRRAIVREQSAMTMSTADGA